MMRHASIQFGDLLAGQRDFTGIIGDLFPQLIGQQQLFGLGELMQLWKSIEYHDVLYYA